MFLFVCSSIAIFSVAVEGRALRDNFLGRGEFFSEEELKAAFVEEIESQYGSVTHRGRLARLEASLAPMFKALPKNEHEKLGHSTVRYALHRIFVQRHGWYIKGLDPAGQHFNTSSPAGVLKTHVTTYVQELFENRLGAEGFSLHDTAVLAATLEHLIHNEAEGRLSKAYDATGVLQTLALNRSQAERVLDSYMKFYLLSDQIATKLPDEEMSEVFPGWRETQTFTRDVLRELARSSHSIDFAQMTAVVEEIGERFGQFQDGECKQMKTKLIGLGDQGIGRVPLPDFYRSSLNGTSFEFQESPAYLRELGVLDDSENVIVPNYVGSHTNCIASSNLYSVCCIDECEQLMGNIEREIASPEASPSAIISLVSGMASSTVEAPRNMPTKLVNRLDEAGQTHGGTVQLHGRLFAQWMHHAFPRECPFPHVSGSINPVTPDEWLDSKGNDGYATREEMLHYTKKSSQTQTVDDLHAHWIEHEELLVPVVNRRRGSSSWRMFSIMVLLAGAVAMSMKSMAPIDLLHNGIASLQGVDNDKNQALPGFCAKSHMC